jgi:AcrR family transcriptional regulator
MTGQARRVAIVQAVLPLFARRGFASTTTRELAEAAGVSEALLYKHFPSKESLYEAILSFGCQGASGAWDKIQRLPASTAALVHLVYLLMRLVALGRPGDPIGWETRHRLVLNSCLEDGAYPRFLFKSYFAGSFERFEACLAAAAAAGDLVSGPVRNRNRCWFAHHLAAMIAVMHLPDEPVIDYGAGREELLNQSVWFALRGLGLTDQAMAAHFRPRALARALGFTPGLGQVETKRGRTISESYEKKTEADAAAPPAAPARKSWRTQGRITSASPSDPRRSGSSRTRG